MINSKKKIFKKYNVIVCTINLIKHLSIVYTIGTYYFLMTKVTSAQHNLRFV